MIIAAAIDFVRAIDDRMPVLLDQRVIDAWLSGKARTELLAQAPNDYLRMGQGQGATMRRARATITQA